MDEFEQELRQTLERRPAPPSLKRNLMALRRKQVHSRQHFEWQKLAAAVVMAAVLGSAAIWGGHAWEQRLSQQKEEQRQGEIARQQVLIALRLTSHALNHMNRQLATHNQPD